MLIGFVDYDVRLPFGHVTAEKGNFLEPAYVVGVAVGYENIPHIGNGDPQLEECLGTLRSTVDEEVIVPLDNQKIGLIFALGKGAPDPEKEQLQVSVVGEA